MKKVKYLLLLICLFIFFGYLYKQNKYFIASNINSNDLVAMLVYNENTQTYENKTSVPIGDYELNMKNLQVVQD